MPRSCCVKNCSNNAKSRPDVNFYILPMDKERRRLWLKAIGRAEIDEDGKVLDKTWSPKTRYHYVCSEHFVTGKKNNFEKHPDYVPSIFPERSTASKKQVTPSRANRRMRRSSSTASVNVISKSKRRLMPQESSQSPEGVTIESPEIPEPSTSFDFSSPVSVTEREGFCLETASLRNERNLLREEVKSLKSQMPFHHQSIKDAAGKCHMLTGLNNNVLNNLIDYVKDFCLEDPNFALCREDQIILTLVKLRHNLTFELLAHISGIGKSTVNDYFWKWIDILYPCLKFLIRMADRDQIFSIIPPVFKLKFPRLTSIIDCFEIFIESPRNLLARAQCYSQYKKHTTIKVFISCSPLGAVNFVSQCWGGRASDIQIVRESEFTTTRYHMPGDQILADRGFTLQEDFALNSGSELIIPAFTRGKKQLSAHEIESTRKIASVRIHIERVIGLIKNRYTILKGIMPIRSVKSIRDEQLANTLINCDKIVTVCAALVNLGESIVFKES